MKISSFLKFAHPFTKPSSGCCCLVWPWDYWWFFKVSLSSSSLSLWENILQVDILLWDLSSFTPDQWFSTFSFHRPLKSPEIFGQLISYCCILIFVLSIWFCTLNYLLQSWNIWYNLLIKGKVLFGLTDFGSSSIWPSGSKGFGTVATWQITTGACSRTKTFNSWPKS